MREMATSKASTPTRDGEIFYTLREAQTLTEFELELSPNLGDGLKDQAAAWA